ncbi:intracellular ribonuclease LX [Daucus carota subsp. sativus]|uniref:intracellular ribonuclease LX n=1 Tax=Daucus carota subsp. sativus TaxID=79200 RepID=UPI003082D82F
MVSCQNPEFQSVYEWNPIYCSENICRPEYVNNQFSFHGLWRRRDLKRPPNIDYTSFEQEVNDNIRVLEGLWPSIVAGNTNEIFWRNEWYKHGSRSGLLAREYINMIIGVANPQVLNNIFNEAGIVPDANNPYTRDRIEDAIKKATGFHALIKCETNEDDNLVLKQVRLCTTYSIINQATVPLPAHCTQKKNPSCGDVNQPPANILLLPAPPLAP